MITLSIFKPTFLFDALHDLESGDNAAHIILTGHSPEHDQLSLRVVFHNLTNEQIAAFKILGGKPRVDDFAAHEAKAGPGHDG